jgi:hypothetical protein
VFRWSIRPNIGRFEGKTGVLGHAATILDRILHSMDARVQQFVTDAQRARDNKTPKDIAKLR